jgi:glycosyltransferase involved in cell wall biosynthesis
VPLRPQVLLFLAFHLLAPVIFFVYCWRRKKSFDLVQMVECNSFWGDLSYSHFCHSVYLKNHWKGAPSQWARSCFQWMNHFVRAKLEKLVYARVRTIVVPSHGLATELASEYPSSAGKIVVIPNPVDVLALRKPDDFCKEHVRSRLGFAVSDLVLVFVALGHFERKGLPLLVECLRRGCGEWKLLVVGGSSQLTDAYQRRAAKAGVSQRIVFAGHQEDVRPFFWAADAFIIPSYYETFSLVAFQAAASSLPVIASRVHGVEDFLQDGANGFLIDTDPESLLKTIVRITGLSEDERISMGLRAQADVQKYDVLSFVDRWRSFYEQAFTIQPRELAS